VVTALQPLNALVFVLDGVLVGASDFAFLAVVRHTSLSPLWALAAASGRNLCEAACSHHQESSLLKHLIADSLRAPRSGGGREGNVGGSAGGGVQAMVVSAACAGATLFWGGAAAGLPGVWSALAVLQGARGATLATRFWLLPGPLPVSTRPPEHGS
jgi:hypothetical protein